MVAFFEGELARRGITRQDLADARPFGGPLYDQLIYEPAACPDSVSITEDGTLNWVGGRARYVYVLEEGSTSPVVPPNLDLPEGTLWRLDVAPESDPVASGLRYGDGAPGNVAGLARDRSPSGTSFGAAGLPVRPRRHRSAAHPLHYGGAMIAFLWLVACAPEDEPDGPSLYIDACASCHGNVGQGTVQGPDLGIVTMGMDVDEVVDVILMGTDAMPPIAMTEEEAELVADFLLNDLLLR